MRRGRSPRAARGRYGEGMIHAASGSDPGAVGVLGATSLVARPLLPMLLATGRHVVACSRSAASRAVGADAAAGVEWRVPGAAGAAPRPIADWIALCPIWIVPDLVDWLDGLGAKRLVALSSQGLVTKRSSPSRAERESAALIAAAESALEAWAAERGTTLCILRPTMIYDGVHDGNVAAVAAFLRRRGWFPVCGRARGLRQPVHAADVAAACRAALEHPAPARHYAISGGETLPYRSMIERIASARGLTARIVPVPRVAWAVFEPVARMAGLARNLPPGAAVRMNQDLSCDHAAAARDLGFQPRAFMP